MGLAGGEVPGEWGMAGTGSGRFLYELPAWLVCGLCRLMDALGRADWERFGTWGRGRDRGAPVELRLCERTDGRTQRLLWSWMNRNARVGDLLALLDELELYRARDLLPPPPGMDLPAPLTSDPQPRHRPAGAPHSRPAAPASPALPSPPPGTALPAPLTSEPQPPPPGMDLPAPLTSDPQPLLAQPFRCPSLPTCSPHRLAQPCWCPSLSTRSPRRLARPCRHPSLPNRSPRRLAWTCRHPSLPTHSPC
uniref:Death domain-containing protein n=1 Tax=Gopherus agassizii TaxID=38772 RepID=A0A452GW83_9SAUR